MTKPLVVFPPMLTASSPRILNSAVAAENRALHEIVAEASTNGIVVCDELGTVLYANRRIAAMLGRHSSELTGLSLNTLLPSATWDVTEALDGHRRVMVASLVEAGDRRHPERGARDLRRLRDVARK